MNLEDLFKAGLIDDKILFKSLFSADALLDTFNTEFSKSAGKGIDRINGFQFSERSQKELAIASRKCINGQYRFTPFLEVLKTKGRDKPPRLIGIPTVRDRVVLHQLNKFIAATHPERVPRKIASAYVRKISNDLKSKEESSTWVCSTDIKIFYDSIQRERLIKTLKPRISCTEALRLVEHSLLTPIVPKNTARKRHVEFRSKDGIPQGLAISNILASIYMQDVDKAMMTLGVTYYRYVDDVLMYGEKTKIEKAFRSLTTRLRSRGLSLHPLNSGKTHLEPLSKPFGYLGYMFRWPNITVRDSTTERFIQSIAAKFSEYTHNKTKSLERFKYLTNERHAEIFLMELNERITGAISEKKRYGWIAYYNQITDLELLHRLDRTIAGLFSRLPDFDRKAPIGLKKLCRAYFEMKFHPEGGYVRNYDKILTRAEKLAFLHARGRIAPSDELTDDQINDRYQKYLHQILSAMHADEGALYG